MESSFLSHDVNPDCSFSDLLVRSPNVSDKSVRVQNIKTKLKTIRNRWTPQECNLLKEQYFEGKHLSTIANNLNRTVSSVDYQLRKLKVKRFKNLSSRDITYLKKNYWILDIEVIAKKLGRKVSAIYYFSKQLVLKRPKNNDAEPPIPRKLEAYDMVKRVSVLERDCPDSKNRIEDSVVIFYNTLQPSTPMMAMHLDNLCLVLDRYFGRRDGVTSDALLRGYKR